MVAFIRSWEYNPPTAGVARHYVLAAEINAGEELFEGNFDLVERGEAEWEKITGNHCTRCHGRSGKGDWPPALNNPEFLTAATDGFLKRRLPAVVRTPPCGRSAEVRVA